MVSGLAATSSTGPAPPSDYICPITNDVMKDPVMDREGNTYERTAIVTWIASNGTSPITRSALAESDLVPNRALRNAIEEWVARHRPGATAHSVPDVEPVGEGALISAGSAAAPPPQPLPRSRQSSLPFTVDVSFDGGSACKIQLSPIPRPEGDRPPVDLVCVIDVSGSMSAEAVARDSEGNAESTGLSVLDVVKHAVLTVAELLGSNDRLSIVSFSNAANVSMQLTSMNTNGKATLKSTLARLAAAGGTNLWAGLQTGMNVAKTATAAEHSFRNTSVFLLTDGRPTYEPPRGHRHALMNYIGDLPNKSLSFSVSTFGFGNNLNSELLSELAQTAHGSFGYIPDSGMVGTVFVNAAANLLATAATTVKAVVTLPPTAEPTNLSHGSCFEPASGTLTIDFGTVAFGQDRVAVFNLVDGCKPVNPIDVGVTVSARHSGGVGKEVANGHDMATDAERASWKLHKLRQDIVRALFGFKGALPQNAQAAKTQLASVETFLPSAVGTAMSAADKALAEAFIFDLKGEVLLGVSNDTNWTRWGQHYAYALGFANELQQCTNFKDHSVQCYGSVYFKELQAQGEKVFLALPPPEPTVPVAPQSAVSLTYATTGAAAAPALNTATTTGTARRAAPRRTSPRNMGWAYNCSGGCVAPTCLVAVRADAHTTHLKQACDVRRGDVMADGSTVECVVKVRIPNGSMEFVELHGGLLVSPYHPVHVGGTWYFPAECPTRVGLKTLRTPHMFSYVLDAADSACAAPCATINGVSVVSFAHECGPEVPVVGHAFFGSGAAKTALKRSASYATDGEVEVCSFVRDVTSLRIVDVDVA